MPPYLLGMGRTRQRNNAAASLCFFVYDLAQPQRRPFFNTFGYRNNQRTVPQIRRGFLSRFTHSKRRCCKHHQLFLRHTGNLCADFQRRRQGNTLEQRVFPLRTQNLRFLFRKRPERNFMPVFQKHQGQRSAPAATANNRNLHFAASSFLCKLNLFSVP